MIFEWDEFASVWRREAWVQCLLLLKEVYFTLNLSFFNQQLLSVDLFLIFFHFVKNNKRFIALETQIKEECLDHKAVPSNPGRCKNSRTTKSKQYKLEH